ncbi:hypothetical protein ACAH01_10120 [Halomicrobium sp. HM KBTZ05]|uniref:Exonuclease RecJ n=1 Tax=Halomicrobium mukohataei TaxID=57705 RepID=A0A847UDX0_9EURY|nr:hypothetical protein [Halomicrobium mukohataei]NLV10427.1 hypothetical protein [Halomicrobium mukohataei]
MSTAGRDQASATPPSDLAGTLDGADFVRLVARADGDGLAATGLLARALTARETPFQASIARTGEAGARTTDADVTVSVGADGVDATATLADEPLSTAAVETVRALGTEPDLALALAGATVADGDSDGATLAEAGGFERRPGVAVPVSEYVDGLAHSTLLHAPFSGERAAVEEAIEALSSEADTDRHRRVASLVALAIAGDETANDRATEAIERALHPYVGGPFETIGGYGDVLDAVARERPGLGVALALGHDGVREQALDVWRTHASRAHTGIRTASTQRYDGLFVVRGDAMPVETVARLVARFRSPEPVTLVVAGDRAAVRGTDDRSVAPALDAATTAVGGTATRTNARFEGDTDDLVEQVREAL